MNRYSAQKQYWKAKQAKQGNHTEAALLKKLQVRAAIFLLRRAGGRASQWRQGVVHRPTL